MYESAVSVQFIQPIIYIYCQAFFYKNCTKIARISYESA